MWDIDEWKKIVRQCSFENYSCPIELIYVSPCLSYFI